MSIQLQLLHLRALVDVSLARRKLKFDFWSLAGWTKRSIASNYTWQLILWNIVPFTWLVHGSGSLTELTCVSLYSCLENHLVEPEIMLMFKDKLKASDLGYQFRGREKNVWSCKLGGRPLAAYLCNQTVAVLGQHAGSGGDRSGL